MVKQAAIRAKGVVHTLPVPNRHSDIIRYIVREGLSEGLLGDEQGFILEDGSFVDRVDAAKIALENNQCETLMSPPRLFSEDLW